jgi:Toprim domain
LTRYALGRLNESLFPPCGVKTLRIDNERLREIRQNTDWRALFGALGIQKDEQKSREHDWWGKSPFSPDERTASFHINDDGWYCFSTNQGGGPIELVQRIFRLNCYEAGRWLLDHGVSSIQAETRADAAAALVHVSPPGTAVTKSAEEKEENRPIRQDLRPLLSPHHAEFERRGIPPEILHELGIGYLDRPPKGSRPDPLNRRLVFQVRGLAEGEDGYTRPVILTHTGRATTAEQEAEHGKWWMYPGFKKRFELYNLDFAVLDEETERQAARTDHVIVVEGCFDVAKLYAAGIRNVVATFGAHLHPEQLPRFELLADLLGNERFLLFYDRDQCGTDPEKQGFRQATEVLCRAGYQVETFDWNRRFPSPKRGEVSIPEMIGDPCEFSLEQLAWLRAQGEI